MINLKDLVKEERDFEKKPIKLCYMSNSPLQRSGYAKVCREIFGRLNKDPCFEVYCLPQFYNGEIKDTAFGRFLPCPEGHFKEAIQKAIIEIKPDILLFLDDLFTLHNYGIHEVDFKNTTTIAYTPCDGDHLPGKGAINILRKFDVCVAMARFTKEVVEKEGFKDIQVIHHGVDLELFKPANNEEQKKIKKRLGLPEDCFLIVNVARNSLRKANTRLLEAVHELCKKNKNVCFLGHIFPVNIKEADLVDFIGRITKMDEGETFYGKQIFFTENSFAGKPPLSDGGVSELYKACDVVLSLSTGEGAGLFHHEGMSCGKPIVSTRYSTTDELVVEPNTGLPIKYDTLHTSSYNTTHAFANIEDAVKQVQKLIDNKELCKELGTNGRKFAEKELSWDLLVYDQWVPLFKELA